MKVRKQIYLTKQQENQLKELTTKTGLSVSDLIRRAIDEYVKEQKN